MFALFLIGLILKFNQERRGQIDKGETLETNQTLMYFQRVVNECKPQIANKTLSTQGFHHAVANQTNSGSVGSLGHEDCFFGLLSNPAATHRFYISLRPAHDGKRLRRGYELKG